VQRYALRGVRERNGKNEKGAQKKRGASGKKARTKNVRLDAGANKGLTGNHIVSKDRKRVLSRLSSKNPKTH